MTGTSDSETLFDRVGGAGFVQGLIDEFYGRILNDPELRPYFDGVSVEHLKLMQAEFFSAALEGPTTRTDFELAKIHKPLEITRRHLTRFVDHLIELLSAHKAIDQKDAMAIVFRIAIYSDQIIGGTSGTDG